MGEALFIVVAIACIVLLNIIDMKRGYRPRQMKTPREVEEIFWRIIDDERLEIDVY